MKAEVEAYEQPICPQHPCLQECPPVPSPASEVEPAAEPEPEEWGESGENPPDYGDFPMPPPIEEISEDCDLPEYSQNTVAAADSAAGSWLARLIESMNSVADNSSLINKLNRLQPLSFINRTLTLGIEDGERLTELEFNSLLESKNNLVIQLAFRKLCPNGRVIIKNMNNSDSEGGQKDKLRHATPAEIVELGSHPVVQKFSQIFQTELIDARFKNSD